MTHYLFTDGSYNRNLNISSIGGQLLDDNKQIIVEFSELLLDPSFFKYHELSALKYGLTQSLSHNIEHLVCYSDDISLRNLNYLEVINDKHVVDPVKKNLLDEIIALKKQFPIIEFRHIKRKLNKKADKLASSVQIDHFYENIFFKERFDIESTKFIHIPNLLCLEDFYSHNSTTEDIEQQSHCLNQQFKQCDMIYELSLHMIDNDNAVAQVYSIDKNTYDKTFILLEQFDIKKVNSHCLNLLDTVFKDIQISPKPSLGFVIKSDNLALKKFDMVLRKRFIFPKIKTPLVDRFLKSCDNFSNIILLSEYPYDLHIKNSVRRTI